MAFHSSLTQSAGELWFKVLGMILEVFPPKFWLARDWKSKTSVSGNKRLHVVWLTAASQCFQIARVANFSTSLSFYNCVTVGGNPAFTVHVIQYATAHAFRAAMKLNSMLLQQTWCSGNFQSFEGLTNFLLKWVWCGSDGSEGSCDDFYLWNIYINADFFCKWATVLSILVIIVNF